MDPLKDLLGRLNISGFDAESYINKNAQNVSALPNIAIALSGGGYRACLNGGGAVQAFDSREINSTGAGHLGGLLQSSTYVAGLSGGGWLVGSIFVNNFTTITDLLDNDASPVWEFGNSIFEGPDKGGIQYVNSEFRFLSCILSWGSIVLLHLLSAPYPLEWATLTVMLDFRILDSADYYTTIEHEVSDKSDAGFNTSVTDYWGRGTCVRSSHRLLSSQPDVVSLLNRMC